MPLLSKPTAKLLIVVLAITFGNQLEAQQQTSNAGSSIKKFSQKDKFRQLEEILPTPNVFRTASGAPGPGYWQQKVDYEIDVRLDDEKQHIHGTEKITYSNKSKDTLTYLWLQLDGNIHRPNSRGVLARNATDPSSGMSMRELQAMLLRKTFDGGFKITKVQSLPSQVKLKHTIVGTMMRVDLPKPLRSGESFKFQVDWNYAINNARVIRGRSGYEYFPRDKNFIYEMAQWFPRLCAYTDSTGWQHKQFLGRGEFTLEMGDYVVRITAPNDHIVASTGTLLNADQVLSRRQRRRLKEAETAKKPVFIVTPEEAKSNESGSTTRTKTWVFKADRVRDFAWASSRKFIWDAMLHNQNGNKVMAMSFYPNEGEPLWSKYSTHAIIHTLEVYSRYTFDYPYPVAISVNGPIGGMEYPMICFNGPRPESDGTYSARTKYGLISVIIHEVGHNYFPMIVNTDERQWTWMDEGLNTFLQYLTEQEWEEKYPSRRGEPKDITGYMSSTNQVPIMTNSESLLQFGPNAYAKPATALNILRETILGREQFDFAFKEYARRWKFKRPMPADFFRTMEDASGVDLDWFWRGWFYSTDHVDLSIENVRQLNANTLNPQTEKGILKKQRDAQPKTMSAERNKSLKKRVDKYPELKDFYNKYDPLKVTTLDRRQYEYYMSFLSEKERKLLTAKYYFYLVDIKNVGGLVMPVIIELHYKNGKKETRRFPVQSWQQNNESITKMLMTDKEVTKIVLDPRLETADTDTSNNVFPREIKKSRFQLFKERTNRRSGQPNPMQLDRYMKELEAEEKARKERALKERQKRQKQKSNNDDDDKKNDDDNSESKEQGKKKIDLAASRKGAKS